MLEALIQDSITALPVAGWVLVGLFVLLVQTITQNVKISSVAALIALFLQLSYSSFHFDPNVSASLFSGAMEFDSMAEFFNLLALLIVVGVVLTSLPGIFDQNKSRGKAFEQYPEFLICLILTGFGASVTASAVDLSVLFLGIETLSIGLYCLCGFFRTEIRSTESALKYLFIGAFSTVIFLYGIALIYGATGSTRYIDIFKTIAAGDRPIVLLGTTFMVVGLAFKLALVPFHFYTPDVYEGAPTPITGFLASIAKLAAIGAAIRLLWGVLAPVADIWQPVWISLCVLSILIGNIAALQQKSIKKLLAFSSISHAGFLGLGVLVAKPGTGVLFPVMTYLFVYSAMTLGIFALISWIEERQRVFYLEDLKGLGLKRVGVGILFSVFVLGFAGIPPFAGFMIKFWIFQALIEQGYIWVALIAILGSLIGAAYYLRILMLLFMTKEDELGAAVQWRGLMDPVYSLRLVVFAALLITLFGGLKPDFYADWILSTIALK